MIYEKEYINLFEDYFVIKERFSDDNEKKKSICDRIEKYSREVISSLPKVKTDVNDMYELFSVINELKENGLWNKFRELTSFTERFDFSMHPIHGFPHTFRCGFYAFCMGVKLGLDEEKLKLCVLASLFHDIGRTDDEFDVVHGEASAKHFPKLFSELDEDSLSVLQAAVHTHCFPEPFDESMWLDYIHVLSIDDARLVSDLLRASDSLDYMRLGISEYDDKYLHSENARKMILLAFEANILFLKFPELFDKIFEIS